MRHFGLPVEDKIPALLAFLTSGNRVLFQASPGAGKSTCLPLHFLSAPFLEGKKIIMLQPRRVAARAVAERLAFSLEESVGETIGYVIRNERKGRDKTRLWVITEGVLNRFLLDDPFLEDVGLIIFDEFHERNIFADVGLAICLKLQESLRPDLKLLVMSATLDTSHLATVLGAPLISCEGTMFPVELRYSAPDPAKSLVENVCRLTARALKEEKGDILVFLPGKGEVMQCLELVQEAFPEEQCFVLHGDLSVQEQQAVLRGGNGQRKTVFSTSIAETSLTIEHLSVVVDSGFSRISKYNPQSGFTRLETVRVSQAAATQRAGRAGRMQAGVCYRNWTEQENHILPARFLPEILEADLAPFLLTILALDLAHWKELPWIDKPSDGAFQAAKSLLDQLGALKGEGLSSHGEKLLSFSAHPRLSNVFMKVPAGDLPYVCVMVALLEENETSSSPTADLYYRLQEVIKSYTGNGSGNRKGAFRKLWTTAEQYARLLKVSLPTSPLDQDKTGIWLSLIYPERMAIKVDKANAVYRTSGGRLLKLGEGDDLAQYDIICAVRVDERGKFAKVFLAAGIDYAYAVSEAEWKNRVTWNEREGLLEAISVRLFKGLEIERKKMALENKGALLAQIEADLKPLLWRYLPDKEEVMQLVNRVAMLVKEGHLPAEALLEEEGIVNILWQTWELKAFCPRDVQEIASCPILEWVEQGLTYETTHALQRFAPKTYKAPTGTVVKIMYPSGNNLPVLAIRLQELFGVKDTPTVGEQKRKLLLHLLSPGYKPIEITSDLASFWKKNYFEVRKDLKARYPKHSWPDNPAEAEPVRGVKRKS